MSKNVLDKIITKKIERIDFLKKSTSLSLLNEIINKNNSILILKKKLKIILLKIKFLLSLKLKKQALQQV